MTTHRTADGKRLPWFAYYPHDFDDGTITLSATQVGAYLRLLNYQWRHGSVPASIDALASIARIPRTDFDPVWDGIKTKFCKARRGLQNRRLETERRKAQKIRKIAAQNASKRWRADTMPRQSGGNAAALPRHSHGNASTQITVHSSTSPKSSSLKGRGPQASLRKPTRREIAYAETLLRNWAGRCRHDPTCANGDACIGRIIQDQRQRIIDGQAASMQRSKS